MDKKILVSTLILAILIVTGIIGYVFYSTRTIDPYENYYGVWKLSTENGQNRAGRISLDNNQTFAVSGCNTGSGEFEIKEDVWHFKVVKSSTMGIINPTTYCLEEFINNQDIKVTLEGQNLKLNILSSNKVLVFTR